MARSLRASRLDQDEQALAVGLLDGLGSRLGKPDGGVCQGHVGNSILVKCCVPRDHIPLRSYALFEARSILREVFGCDVQGKTA